MKNRIDKIKTEFVWFLEYLKEFVETVKPILSFLRIFYQILDFFTRF